MANNLLYLSLEKPDPALSALLERAGWKSDVVDNPGRAQRHLQTGRYSAGLFVATQLDDNKRHAIEVFFKSGGAMQWIGVFSAAFLQSPHSHEFVFNHFFDFHTLPVDIDRLIHTLGHAHGVHLLQEKLVLMGRPATTDLIVGDSPAIRKHLRDIRKIASVDAPVLISGPSGSGKELAAQAIHRLSERAAGPFIAVNCSALPESLIQSELFGHEKGAFSGAMRAKQGFIEAAAGGTIFLDEIGDIPIDQQTNLLRFLQEKTINRIGSTRPLHVDTRVIAASHVNLEQAVTAGRFREDLYYRLNVLPLTVPSLHERREDIQQLAEHFYELFAKERNPRLKGFGTTAIHAMHAHSWPGNVRELLNRVRRALIMAEGRLITDRDLGLAPTITTDEQVILTDARAAAERNAIILSLSNSNNNLTHAARELGVSRMTLYRLLEKHRIRSNT